MRYPEWNNSVILMLLIGITLALCSHCRLQISVGRLLANSAIEWADTVCHVQYSRSALNIAGVMCCTASFCVVFAGGRRCECDIWRPAEDQQICQEHESNDGAEKRNRVEESKCCSLLRTHAGFTWGQLSSDVFSCSCIKIKSIEDPYVSLAQEMLMQI